MKERSAFFLNLLQTVAIVAGLVYGALQLTQFREEQRRQSKLEMARSFMTPEFHEAFALILSMPDSVDSKAVESRFEQDMSSFLLLAQTFESIGILVHQDDLDLPLVDDFFGGGVITSWRNLKPWFEEYRLKNNAPSAGEWFQWLAERLEEYRDSTSNPAPAYEAFRNWKRPL